MLSKGPSTAVVSVATLRAKHAAMSPVFTERSRRIWAAAEAQALGRGGTALVERATGISASTIRRGVREVAAGDPLVGTRTRKAGGGRKRAIDLDPTLLRDLDALVEPTAPGDPDSPLRWTCLSARTLAVALGDRVSHTVVAELLHALGHSLQGNVKTREGRQHVDRDAQFRYRAARAHRPTAPAADDLRRRQEEGARRRVQECRPDVASGEDAPAGARPRLHRARDGYHGRQGDSVWCTTCSGTRAG